jgi:hypothetical protein
MSNAPSQCLPFLQSLPTRNPIILLHRGIRYSGGASPRSPEGVDVRGSPLGFRSYSPSIFAFPSSLLWHDDQIIASQFLCPISRFSRVTVISAVGYARQISDSSCPWFWSAIAAPNLLCAEIGTTQHRPLLSETAVLQAWVCP